MPFLLVGLLGSVVGFTLAGGTSDVSRLVKWAAIGGMVYVGGKWVKAW